MAGTIDRATLDRLIALGRERGELTASELQAALPVEALDVDALTPRDALDVLYRLKTLARGT